MVGLVFFFGAAIGSFLDVVADRFPRGVRPLGRSHCEGCARALLWYELIPVVSWLMLRGRCRTCGSRIPFRHLFVEAGLGLAFVFAATWHIEPQEPATPWLIILRWLTLSAFAVVLLADLRFFIIPDSASFGLMALFGIAVLAAALFPDVPWVAFVPSPARALYGVLFGIGFLGSFALISRGGWMGWGDVKLAAGLGVAFGFPAVLFLLAFAFVLGACAGLFLVVIRRRRMRDLLPFGPFMVLGALPALFGYEPAIERFFGVSEFLLMLHEW